MTREAVSNILSSAFHLTAHPTARSQAVANSSLPAGATILSTEPLAAVLIESEKGQRCDFCFRVRKELHRCTGCKYYCYCDSTCQMKAWKAHHRRLCRRLPGFLGTPSYLHLSPPERAHSFLLAHLLAEHAKALCSAFSRLNQQFSSGDISDPITVLLSLLPRNDDNHIPELPPLDRVPNLLVAFLSCRFGNNNFTIHSSRIDAFANGIFPLASRSFNHSCVPSAVPVYIVSSESTSVKMNIQLIRNMKEGEEITIPYIDPALPYSSRQRDLNLTYGFTCTCSLCQRTNLRAPISSVPPSELAKFETNLCEVLLPSLLHDDARIESAKLREEFLPAFHPSYLPSLAEAFSRTSHCGPYDMALQKGDTLLALYCLIYPENYPLIGLHALELAKTYWNAYVTNARSRPILEQSITYLALAERTFSVLFGRITEVTHDDGEPVDEMRLLRQMVQVELERDMNH